MAHSPRCVVAKYLAVLAPWMSEVSRLVDGRSRKLREVRDPPPMASDMVPGRSVHPGSWYCGLRGLVDLFVDIGVLVSEVVAMGCHLGFAPLMSAVRRLSGES